MSRKYELISELYDRTCKTVVSNPQNWQNFLRSACRNYKLRYDEQLLIYAQRPDATAVLEIERWNRSFGRWVNKGASNSYHGAYSPKRVCPHFYKEVRMNER